jgi:hypothetical protein
MKADYDCSLEERKLILPHSGWVFDPAEPALNRLDPFANALLRISQ